LKFLMPHGRRTELISKKRRCQSKSGGQKEIEMRCAEMLFKAVLLLLVTLVLAWPSYAAKPLSDGEMKKQVGQKPIVLPGYCDNGPYTCLPPGFQEVYCGMNLMTGLCETVTDVGYYSCRDDAAAPTNCSFPAPGLAAKSCLTGQMHTPLPVVGCLGACLSAPVWMGVLNTNPSCK
jgi:hypothetical protein